MDCFELIKIKDDLNQYGIVVFDINKEKNNLEEVAGWFALRIRV